MRQDEMAATDKYAGKRGKIALITGGVAGVGSVTIKRFV